VTRIHVIVSLALIAIGLVLMFDALSPHGLEWPLSLLVLAAGIVWIVGRVGWWIVWKGPAKRP
jgi:hypothetical protein